MSGGIIRDRRVQKDAWRCVRRPTDRHAPDICVGHVPREIDPFIYVAGVKLDRSSPVSHTLLAQSKPVRAQSTQPPQDSRGAFVALDCVIKRLDPRQAPEPLRGASQTTRVNLPRGRGPSSSRTSGAKFI